MATSSATSQVITVTTTADRGAGSLRAAIARAKSGATIRFAQSLANKTITLTSGQLAISPGKNLVIDGSGAANLTISGNNKSRLFFVNSNQATPTRLTLKQLTLANGYTADRGGAITGEHKANITVANVKFKNNVADKGGGAIYSGWENNLTVTGSQFTGNKAIAGNDERGAGAIAFNSPGALVVRNSTFTGNRGINGAAINSLIGSLTVDSCTFTNNDVKAARFASGQPNDFLRGYGGAIYTDRASDSISITKSTFSGNVSRSSGGAVHLFTDPEDKVTIASSQFLNNQAIGGVNNQDKGKGGAIAHIRNSLGKGSLTLRDLTVANNTGYDQGGGLWVYNARTTITNGTFSGNKLMGSGTSNIGGAMTLYSPAQIVNSTIANNFAGWVAGGICAADNAAVSVQNTIFYKNTAANGSNNWGIQQHTNRPLTDKGGNIQFPPKKTNFGNDTNATARVQLVDPRLAPLKDNGGGLLTHALLSGSPAINKGVNAGAPTLDQRGYKRDSKIDSGAFEAVASRASRSYGLSASSSGTSRSDALTGRSAGSPIGAATRDDLLLGGATGGDRSVSAAASPLAALAEAWPLVSRSETRNLGSSTRAGDAALAAIQPHQGGLDLGQITARGLATVQATDWHQR